MMNTKKTNATRAVSPIVGLANRRGEGHEVAIVHEARLGTDGTSLLSMGIDMSTAPVPERQYVADIFSVATNRHGVSIMFAQEKIGGGLRSLLIVQMASDRVKVFVRSLDEMTDPTLSEVLSASGFVSEGPTTIAEEPAQTLSVKANMLSAAFTNGEACIDFYSMSAFVTSALIRHREQAKGQVVPVVRVELASAQLWGLADALRPLILADSE